MTVESRTVTIFTDIVYTLFTIIYLIFFIIILRPLYKFCKTRTALYILFSKSFANFIFQFISIYQLSTKYILPPSTNLLIIKYCLSPIFTIIINGTFIHMAGLAINRFHSVFFLFNYQSAWKLRNIKYFILTIWFVTFIFSALQTTLIYMNINGILSVLYKGIFTSGDVSYIASFCFSASIAILTKFCYKYITNKNNNSEIVKTNNTTKDRILILIICLVSTTPVPIFIGTKLLSNSFDQYSANSTEDLTFLFTILEIIFNLIYLLFLCIEDICLVIMSKDFRKLIKQQFIKKQQNNNRNVVVNTIHVSSQYPQHYRQHQFNRQNYK